jgi:hypothetical protein
VNHGRSQARYVDPGLQNEPGPHGSVGDLPSSRSKADETFGLMATVRLAAFSIRVQAQGMARCRARTKDGTGPLCTRKVKKEGLRCWQHKGLPTAPSRLSMPPKPRRRGASRTIPTHERRAANRVARAEAKQRERIQKAADYCSDILTDGWAAAVADRAAEYVTDQTWHRLFRSRSNHCKTLARIAQRILAGKDKFHGWLGDLIAWLLSLVGISAAAREFAGELASNIPILPIDAKIAAVTRGIQVTGILLCVIRDEDLTKCKCFIDLVLVEAKTTIKKILVTAIGDWTQLANFPLQEAV